MYPPELQEQITKVEAGREERLKVPFRRITLEEKEQLLKVYHPDYVAGAMRDIKWVPIRVIALNELVDC
jgi:succinate dehydrogenase / fumarate reductase flavoprotein subunit